MTETTEEPELRFCEPPPIAHAAHRDGGKVSDYWTFVALQCRARPGQWAHIGRHPASQVTRIRQGKLAAFTPMGSWDATSREMDSATRRADLWIKYLGNGTYDDSDGDPE